MSAEVVFALKPKDSEILGLIERYHRTNSSSETSDALCLDAGRRVQGGDFSKENLRVMYRWKMASRKYLKQEQKYFDKNSDESVARVLRYAVGAVSNGDVGRAFRELQSLEGIGLAVASAFLTAIFPEQFTVIDIIAFRALGVPEKTPLTVPLYIRYLSYCDHQARRLGISLRDMDRALWQWGHESPC